MSRDEQMMKARKERVHSTAVTYTLHNLERDAVNPSEEHRTRETQQGDTAPAAVHNQSLGRHETPAGTASCTMPAARPLMTPCINMCPWTKKTTGETTRAKKTGDTAPRQRQTARKSSGGRSELRRKLARKERA